jgi:hypothetical protein
MGWVGLFFLYITGSFCDHLAFLCLRLPLGSFATTSDDINCFCVGDSILYCNSVLGILYCKMSYLLFYVNMFFMQFMFNELVIMCQYMFLVGGFIIVLNSDDCIL